MSNQNADPSSIETLPAVSVTQTPTLPSATGAVTPSSSPVKDALKALDSDQVRREVGALCARRWRSLQRTVSAEYDLTGFRVTGQLTSTEREEIRSLSRALTRPADRDQVTQELTKCLLVTKSRAKPDEDMTMYVAAMTDELAKYPMDLVATSLRAWARKETFWPSLAEILAPIKREMGWRKSLETAAGTVVAANQGNQRSTWSQLPQDRKDRINDALRKAGISDPIP